MRASSASASDLGQQCKALLVNERGAFALMSFLGVCGSMQLCVWQLLPVIAVGRCTD